MGLGDAGLDLVLHVPRLPRHDEKILASRIERLSGGVVANVMCALTRLGTHSRLLACVGDDEAGRFVMERLRGFGVDVTRVAVKAGEDTCFSVGLLDASGEKALVLVATSAMFPSPDDLAADAFYEADLLHTTGLRIDTTLKAVALAKRNGMPVSLDLEPSTLQQGWDGVRQILADTQIVFLNQHSIDDACPGEPDPGAAAATFLGYGPKIVVLTRGSKGSIVRGAGMDIRTPGFSVPVADTTGAGDCFNASFLHGYLQGWPVERTALFANAAAALSIAAVGAQTALPTVEQVEAFLARSPRGSGSPREG